MSGRIELTKRFLGASAAVAMVVISAANAQAFYWPGWPGAGVAEPPSFTPKQVVEDFPPPKTPLDPTDPPKQVPEPATLVIAGLGLGVLGLRKVLKRRVRAPDRIAPECNYEA